jgi:hypothetical protein
MLHKWEGRSMAVSIQASVAQMVAKLLARRATPQDEIPVLIRTVEGALQALTGARPPEPADVEAPVPAHEPRAPRPRRPRAAAKIAEPPPPALLPPPQPRLVRRAEVVPAAFQEDTPRLRPPQPSGALRGIVKWFDQRTRRGALRLPGCGDEVAVETGLLDDMGITRLYKGQEIEATLSDEPNPRVVRLAIPGGVWQVHPAGGVVRNRHHARPVVVEMKREALRRVAARVEAEHLLGPGRVR